MEDGRFPYAEPRGSGNAMTKDDAAAQGAQTSTKTRR